MTLTSFASATRRTIVVAFLLGAVLAPGLAVAQAPTSYPLALSADGRHLVDRMGRPFFMNGDAAWSLVAAVSKEDAELYLEDRRRKGFNLVLVTLLDHKFSPNPPRNFYGHDPFEIPGNFSRPREAYFAHVDWVVQKAREKGIVVLLAPLYLGWGCGDEGWCREIEASSPGALRAYGRYIGDRYKAFPNIIWVIGGDADPSGGASRVNTGLRRTFRQLIARLTDRAAARARQPPDVRDKVREFVAGLRERDRAHLMSAHNARDQAAMDPWPGEPWLDLNNIYTREPTHVVALQQWRRTPFKPFFLIETYYENEHNSTPLSLRRQAYWTVLSGGILGHVFGNCQIWGFSHGFCKDSWKAQLSSVGSTTVSLVGRLFESRAFHRLVPDDSHRVLTAGVQSGETYAAAARAADGSTAIAYIPTQRDVVINLASISGPTARAWWFNPRTGTANSIGTYRTSGEMKFIPPDRNDWVLVVDNASLNLPAPGTQQQ